MLLITRRRGEGFTIGDNVQVTLIGFRNGAAQIGINAPRDVSVLRNELTEEPAGSSKNQGKPRDDD